MTTLYDVARIAGVSTATVSNVINQTKRVSPATTARSKTKDLKPKTLIVVLMFTLRRQTSTYPVRLTFGILAHIRVAHLRQFTGGSF